MNAASRWYRLRPWKRHSLVLVVAGTVYILIGISYAVIPGPPTRSVSMKVALSVAPMWFWGLVFALAGVSAILSSRWPPASDTWGYAVMSSLAVLWAMFYLGGIFLGSPVSNVTGVLIWSILGFLWWAISGLHNPQDLTAPEDPYPARGTRSHE